jgi:hypothetical protein
VAGTVIASLYAVLGLEIDKKSWSSGDKLVSTVKKAILGFIGLEAVEKIGDMISATVEYGSALNDTAQKTGIAVDSLQYLGFVAKQNSSNMEEVAGATEKLSRGMAESAKAGTGPAADGFNALGLSMAAFANMPVDERIQRIAEKLSALPDGAKKTAIAMDLFGRSGAQLIPTLNDLGQNGERLTKEFNELGGAISEKEIAALDEFGDTVDKAKYSLSALRNQAVIALLPTLKSMLASFQEFVKQNRGDITAAIRTGVELLINGVKYLAQGILVLLDLFKFLRENWEVTRVALIAIGAVFVATAVEAAAAWVVAALPIFAVVAALTAVGLIVYDVWKSIKTGKGVTASVFGWMRDQVAAFGDKVIGVGHSIVDAFARAWDAIKSAAKAAFEWIVNLPVVKQLIEVYEHFKNTGPKEVKQAAVQANAANESIFGGFAKFLPGTAGAAAIASQSAPVIVQPANVTINTGETDPAKVAALAGKATADAQGTAIRNALDSVRGGKK